MTGRLYMVIVAVALTGCAGGMSRRGVALAPTTQATTARAARENTVAANNFDRLWRACADAARDRRFVIDRRDYRGGVLTTEPLVSAQFFEPWRRDAITPDAVAESSLATIRRTIRFEFTRQEGDRFTVIPRVTVERYSSGERRITSATLYRSAFRRTTATGTRESDRGVVLPPRYWYNVGNDAALEKALAEAVRRRLRATTPRSVDREVFSLTAPRSSSTVTCRQSDWAARPPGRFESQLAARRDHRQNS